MEKHTIYDNLIYEVKWCDSNPQLQYDRHIVSKQDKVRSQVIKCYANKTESLGFLKNACTTMCNMSQ